MRKTMLPLGLAALVALPAMASARGEKETQSGSAKKAGTSGPTEKQVQMDEGAQPFASDQEFLQTLHVVNLAEVKMGQMALEKSDDPAVEDLARMLVEEHRKADKVVTEFAAQKKITLNEPLNITFPELEPLQGREFDRAFLQQNVKLHETLIPRIQAHIDQKLDDPQAKARMKGVVDHLQAHRRHASAALKKIEEQQPVRGVEEPEKKQPIR